MSMVVTVSLHVKIQLTINVDAAATYNDPQRGKFQYYLLI